MINHNTLTFSVISELIIIPSVYPNYPDSVLRMIDDIDGSSRYLFHATSIIIRMTSVQRAKSSGRKLDLNSVATGALLRLVRSALYSRVRRVDLSREVPRKKFGGVCAPFKIACCVQDVVELLLSRADPSAARSRRSVRFVQGEVASSPGGEALPQDRDSFPRVARTRRSRIHLCMCAKIARSFIN